MLLLAQIISEIINIVLWIPVATLIVPIVLLLTLYKMLFEKLAVYFKPTFRPPNNLMDATMVTFNTHIIAHCLPFHTNCKIISVPW